MILGGIDTTRLVHRYSGIMLAIMTVQHVFVSSFGLIVLKWQPSMVIHKKDFQDAIDNIRYYLGLSEYGARCDRYDYKQKFEYWGVVVGGNAHDRDRAYASGSPRSSHGFSRESSFPVAKAMHTNEALLAFLVDRHLAYLLTLFSVLRFCPWTRSYLQENLEGADDP